MLAVTVVLVVTPKPERALKHLTYLEVNRRFLLAGLLGRFPPQPAANQDIRNTELAHPKTNFALRSYSSRREWELRRLHLRRQILGAGGLLPLAPSGSVKVEIVGRDRYNGFATESILLETLPGYFVGATIYRPQDTTRRWPAVLIAHGHWKRGRVEHLPSYSVPALGANLALQGYVAIAWDMVGFNDTRQTPHDFGGWREQLWGFNPLGLQLWNSIRVVDYIVSRRDVDPRRVACTGASGGATQTILLSAVDSRIACSAPVNMISASYQGADPCEEAPNLRLGTNNVEIASLMAPRPMLVVSCTGDWTRNTPVTEYPAIRQVYDLYGRADAVRNAHFEAEHNYDAHTRRAVYQFLAQHLQNRPDAHIPDQPLPPLRAEDLLSGGPELPSSALNYDGVFAKWIGLSRRSTAADTSGIQTLAAMQAALGCVWPDRVESSGFGDRLLMKRAGEQESIPALWLPGRGTPAVLIHSEGSEASRDSHEIKRLRSEGRPVLSVDVFQTGLAQGARERGGRWFLSYNQTDDANRVQDILTALSWLRGLTREEPQLVGMGRAAIWTVFAGAVARYPVSVIADVSANSGSDEDMRDHFFVPGIQRAGGLPAAVRLNQKLGSEP